MNQTMRIHYGVLVAMVLLGAALLPRGATAQLEPLGPVRQDPALLKAFSGFLKTATLQVESVPDLYPGGYARISLYAQKASLGGLVVEEVWFKLVGASLDPGLLGRGKLKLTDARETAMHGRASIKGLESFFTSGDGIKDIRLWSDGQSLFAEGTVPLNGISVRVFLQGYFTVNGSKELFFHIQNARLNGLPIFSFLLRSMESKINPVMSQTAWPVTFNIRAIRMTKEEFLLSSQRDLAAPCGFCIPAGLAGP